MGIPCAAGGISVGALHSFGGGAVRRENIRQLQVRGKIPPAGFSLSLCMAAPPPKTFSGYKNPAMLRRQERAWRSVGSFSLKVTGSTGCLPFT